MVLTHLGSNGKMGAACHGRFSEGGTGTKGLLVG